MFISLSSIEWRQLQSVSVKRVEAFPHRDPHPLEQLRSRFFASLGVCRIREALQDRWIPPQDLVHRREPLAFYDQRGPLQGLGLFSLGQVGPAQRVVPFVELLGDALGFLVRDRCRALAGQNKAREAAERIGSNRGGGIGVEEVLRGAFPRMPEGECRVQGKTAVGVGIGNRGGCRVGLTQNREHPGRGCGGRGRRGL